MTGDLAAIDVHDLASDVGRRLEEQDAVDDVAPGPAGSPSAAKAETELGWMMRPLRETLLDTATSLVEHGIVKA